MQQWRKEVDTCKLNNATELTELMKGAAKHIPMICGKRQREALSKFEQDIGSTLARAKQLDSLPYDAISPIPAAIDDIFRKVCRLCDEKQSLLHNLVELADRQTQWLNSWQPVADVDVSQLQLEATAFRRAMKTARKNLIQAQANVKVAETDTDSEQDDTNNPNNGSSVLEQLQTAKQAYGAACKTLDAITLRLNILSSEHFPVSQQF